MYLEESWLEISMIFTMVSLLYTALSHFTKNAWRLAVCSGLRFGPMKARSSVLYFFSSPVKADLVWEYAMGSRSCRANRMISFFMFLHFREINFSFVSLRDFLTQRNTNGFLFHGINDTGKIFFLECCAANEAAIHIGFGENFFCI